MGHSGGCFVVAVHFSSGMQFRQWKIPLGTVALDESGLIRSASNPPRHVYARHREFLEFHIRRDCPNKVPARLIFARRQDRLADVMKIDRTERHIRELDCLGEQGTTVIIIAPGSLVTLVVSPA